MKNALINTIIWGIVSILWTVLAVWRVLDNDETLSLVFTIITAVLSLVCFVLNLIRFVRERRAQKRQETTALEVGEA